MTTTLQPISIEQKCQKMRDQFHKRGWRTSKVAKWHYVYMVYKPNHQEHCYFVAFRTARGGTFSLIPEQPDLESYKEAKSILRECDG